MNIAFFGPSSASCSGIVRALRARGHRVTVYELDAHRRDALAAAGEADAVVLWDVDPAATLANMTEPFRALLPAYDLVLTHGGGEAVCARYRELGARDCVPVHNALDPQTHHPVPADERFLCDLALVANGVPDGEAGVEEFFLRPAALFPNHDFLLGAADWQDRPLPPSVRLLGHVGADDQNAVNCSAVAVLNVTESGSSLPARVLEAAGAGACVITDPWEGIEACFEPGQEVLVAHDAADVGLHLEELTPERARAIGAAAQARVLEEHTYDRRAELVERALKNP